MNRRILIGILGMIVGAIILLVPMLFKDDVVENSDYTKSMMENGYNCIDKVSDNIYENIDAAIDYIVRNNKYNTVDITYINSSNAYGTILVDLIFDGEYEWLVEITNTKIFLNMKYYEEEYYEETEEDWWSGQACIGNCLMLVPNNIPIRRIYEQDI